jgi:hypothetical protein
VQLRAETSVDAEELLVHDCGQGKTAERLHAGIVDGLGVLVLAFELEGEVIGQVATLVVSSQQPEGLGVMDLERPEVKDTLYTEVTTINVITKEEVACLGWVATDLEELHQVVVLAVNVTTDSDGGIHLEEIGLGAQELGALLNNPEGLLIGETSLTIEVLLQESNVGLGMGLVLEELLVGRLEHGGGLNVWRVAGLAMIDSIFIEIASSSFDQR